MASGSADAGRCAGCTEPEPSTRRITNGSDRANLGTPDRIDIDIDIDNYELALALVGLVALVAAWIPAYTARRPLSLPVVLLGFGAVIFALPFDLPRPDPAANLELVERLTEIGVTVALMGAGLKIDRPFSWRTWAPTWRMLAIAMPITIALGATLGAAMAGFGAASALLLGAVLAPTDPVLASDVQVGEPELDEEPTPNAEEDVRFTLTSEGGLNDALAFPFVYLAIHVARDGWDPSAWVVEWIGWDLVARIAIALAVGWLVGRLLGVISFHPLGPLRALADTPQGFVAVGATLLAYGATELLHGYGFLAVFVAAVMLRGSERNHEFQTELHAFIEQTENLLVVGLLLLFGGSLVSGVLDGISWTVVLIALLMVLVVRPLSGGIALIGSPLTRTERFAISFFGIRGFGSIYYLAYALSEARFPQADTLWAIVAVTLVVSIATHGVTATPMMRIVDRARWKRSRHDRRSARSLRTEREQ